MRDGTDNYRYLKTVVGEQLVHVIVVDDGGGLSGFTDFTDDLTDAERSGGTIVIDMASVTVLESHLLDSVHRAARRIHMRSDRCILVCPNGQLRKLLEMTGIDQRVAIYNSVIEAITAVRAGEVA